MGEVAVGYAPLKPVVTLLRGPMGERLGDHVTLGLLLEIVVADLRSAVEGFFNLPPLDGVLIHIHHL